MRKPEYLISSMREANWVARERGPRKDQWTYIPWRDNIRESRLRGRRGYEPHQLIGDFYDWEREYLLRK